jgi:uncharacterized protein YegP (UPF0339 family)
MKAVVKKGRGRMSRQFMFVLRSANGKTICASEFYKRKLTMTRIIKKYFPSFKIHDIT